MVDSGDNSTSAAKPSESRIENFTTRQRGSNKGRSITTANMGLSFDYAPDRPENIEAILNGLDRYNPETTGTFQEYVAQQCENQTYDCYANLALLKLYVITD